MIDGPSQIAPRIGFAGFCGFVPPRTFSGSTRDRKSQAQSPISSGSPFSRAASVPARHLALIVVGFLLVRAISRDGVIFKILHRGCDRLPNPLERHLAPSIGSSVHLLLATTSR